LAAKKEEVLAVLASKPMTKDDLRAAVRVDRAKLTVWLKEYELEGVIRWRKSNGQRVYELAEKKEEGA
jgi:predicted Rossmann fold nucleotide-binding protein DprA/Smf involved in DNA uptake